MAPSLTNQELRIIQYSLHHVPGTTCSKNFLYEFEPYETTFSVGQKWLHTEMSQSLTYLLTTHFSSQLHGWILLISHFKGENRSTERLNHLPKISWLETGEVRI